VQARFRLGIVSVLFSLVSGAADTHSILSGIHRQPLLSPFHSFDNAVPTRNCATAGRAHFLNCVKQYHYVKSWSLSWHGI
jgi:hypothetical protein